MYFIDSNVFHKDDRGFIYSVIHNGEWREINYVESQAGSVRGGHYHKETLECFFVIKGSIDVYINNIKNGVQENFNVKGRSVFVVEPFEVHEFKVLEDSAWINILSKPMDSRDKDMHRI